MANYWVSFTVHNGDRPKGTYGVRRQHIYTTTQGTGLLNPNWTETTSFVLFSAGDNIDAVGRKIAAGLDGAVDILLIGQIGFKSERYWGAVKYPNILQSLYPTIVPLK